MEKANLPKYYIYCKIEVTDFGNLLHLWQEPKYRRKEEGMHKGILWIKKSRFVRMNPLVIMDLLRNNGFSTFGDRTYKSIKKLQEALIRS